VAGIAIGLLLPLREGGDSYRVYRRKKAARARTDGAKQQSGGRFRSGTRDSGRGSPMKPAESGGHSLTACDRLVHPLRESHFFLWLHCGSEFFGLSARTKAADITALFCSIGAAVGNRKRTRGTRVQRVANPPVRIATASWNCSANSICIASILTYACQRVYAPEVPADGGSTTPRSRCSAERGHRSNRRQWNQRTTCRCMRCPLS